MEEQKQKTVADYEQAMLGAPDEQPIDPNGFYYIDFDKITRAEDIVAILAAVNFSFVGNHPRVHLVAHLLDRNNVQYPKDQFKAPVEDVPKEDKAYLEAKAKREEAKVIKSKRGKVTNIKLEHKDDFPNPKSKEILGIDEDGKPFYDCY